MQVTLKDIAEKCGVSPTLVSAVLNRRQGNICCGEERRKQICDTARELGYRTNLMARSMVLGRSPLVGVMLSVERAECESQVPHYFNQVFPSLTFKLNEHRLEALFVPYRDEDDQLERFERLYGAGLIGGVVTNLIPRHYSRIAPRLAEAKLPYIVLGWPRGFDCHCVYTVGNFEWMKEYELKHEIRRSFLLTEVRGELMLFAFPLPDNYLWLQEPVRAEEKWLRDPENLIVCSGVSVYRRLARKPHHTVIIEPDGSAEPCPPEASMLFVGNNQREKIVTLAANHIAKWMLENHEPEIRENRIPPAQVNAQFLR